eukprot:RCo026967
MHPLLDEVGLLLLGLESPTFPYDPVQGQFGFPPPPAAKEFLSLGRSSQRHDEGKLGEVQGGGHTACAAEVGTRALLWEFVRVGTCVRRLELLSEVHLKHCAAD